MKELSWRQRGRLWMRLGIRLVLAVLILLVLCFAAPPLLSLFMPFVLAFLLAWLLNPVIKWAQKRVGVSRKLLAFVLIALIFAGAGGVLIAFVSNIVGELVSLANNWQSILVSLQSAVEAVSNYFSRFMDVLPEEVGLVANQLVEHLLSWLQTTLPGILSSLASKATSLAMGIPSFAVASVVFIMGSYFITADYPHIRFLLTDRLAGSLRNFLSHVKTTAISAFGGYVKAQFILSIGVFFILLVGFTLVQQPYGLLLAFLLSILDFIPIVGAGTAMVPWAVIDLLTGNMRHAVELMVIWGVIALFRRVGEPKVVGDQTGLPPVMSLISIYVGMRLADVWGMILGPVVCMIIINICRLGIFDNTLADLRMAAEDLSAILKNRSESDQSSKIV